MPQLNEERAHSFDLTVEALRDVRSEEPWIRVDTICIGKGAKNIDDGWFENFADFANASELIWFTSGRTKKVGQALCNLSGPSEDYAQRIYQSGVEFIPPIGFQGFEENVADSGFMQSLWVQDLPNMMSTAWKLQDVDNILICPAIHQPAGTGVSGQVQNGAGSLFSIAGQTGDANLRNTWGWPQPLGIPAKSKIEVAMTIANPMKDFLRDLPDELPAQAQIPTTENNELKLVPFDNWYKIRVWLRGPRYVQLRGATSAVG